MMHKAVLLVLVASLGCCLASGLMGCSQKPDHPQTYPVAVTVTQNGQPLAGATVCFINSQRGISSGSGMSQEGGKVAVKTFEPGDGLMPGSYKVTIRKSESRSTPNPQDPAAPPIKAETIWHVPQNYSSVSSTPFRADVTPNGKNEFTFDVK